MDLAQWLSLVSLCLLGAMSPGPSLAAVMNNTLSGGHKAGYITSIAHGVGVALYGLLTVTGLAFVVTSTPALFLTIQVAGSLYLIYLGIKSLRSTGAANFDPRAEKNHRGAAADGFLIAFLNPKLAVFMLALFSQLLQPDSGATHKAIMVVTVGVTDALWYSLIAALVSYPAFYQRLKKNSVIIDRVFGVVLLLLGCSVLVRALMG